MAREQRERMLAMVTWITQLEWQMDRQLLLEWRRMNADWYRAVRRRKGSKFQAWRGFLAGN